MAHKKFFIITLGEPVKSLPCAMTQLVELFATSQNLSLKIIEANPDSGSFSSLFPSCDQVRKLGSANFGKEIVAEYANDDVLLFHLGQSPNTKAELVTFIRAAQMEAVVQGRSLVAYLRLHYIHPGAPTSIQLDGFSVRLMAELEKRVSHKVLYKPASCARVATIPVLGSGLGELIQRYGPTLSAFLNNPPSDYSFAVNHVIAWVNKCIDTGIFDNLIKSDQLVARSHHLDGSNWERTLFKYQFDIAANLEEVQDEQLARRYDSQCCDHRN